MTSVAGLEVASPKALGARSYSCAGVANEAQTSSCMRVPVVPLTEAVEDAIAGEFFGEVTDETTERAEGRGARVARAGTTLVSVAVADDPTAVAEPEPGGQQPFESAPGGVDLHHRFQLRIVNITDAGVATADVGEDHAVLVGHRLEKQLRVGSVGIKVVSLGEQRV